MNRTTAFYSTVDDNEENGRAILVPSRRTTRRGVHKAERKRVTRLAKLHSKWPTPPKSVISYLNGRSRQGFTPYNCRHLQKSFSNRRVPLLWTEKELSLGEINKVFASHWISEDAVVMGTKCNKLIVLNTAKGWMDHIPMIGGLGPMEDRIFEDGSGIHAISLNPSQSYLATGGVNPNDLGIYSMPDFSPICVGEGCHRDWIFDIKWLDDEFVATGSRDGTIALWSIADAQRDTTSTSSTYKSIQPRCRKKFSEGGVLHEDDHMYHQKVRALEFNKHRRQLASIEVSSGCITFWDVCGFREILTKKLHHDRESVCMAFSETYNLYGVGSQSHVTLLDSRKARNVGTFQTKEICSGVRSLCYQGDILSVGTGMGKIKFIDVRMMSYLQNGKEDLSLNAGKGWLSRDEIYYHFFNDASYRNAIYTHCYDYSGTKLFAAGGPLPSGLTGNYAGLFQ